MVLQCVVDYGPISTDLIAQNLRSRIPPEQARKRRVVNKIKLGRPLDVGDQIDKGLQILVVEAVAYLHSIGKIRRSVPRPRKRNAPSIWEIANPQEAKTSIAPVDAGVVQCQSC